MIWKKLILEYSDSCLTSRGFREPVNAIDSFIGIATTDV